MARPIYRPVFTAIALSVLTVAGATAQSTAKKAAPAGLSKAERAAYDRAVAKGINYLLTKGRNADGAYSPEVGSAITAIATTALLKHGRSPDDPQIAKSLKYLEAAVQADGGVYSKDSRMPNYETCIALICFASANKDGRYDQQIERAEKYIKGLQFDGEEGHDESSIDYGGAGYGGKSRPDLSNTAMLLDALQAAGRTADDEAVKKAMTFVSRCQNLESEKNTTKFAAKIEDGGFFYTPAAGGSSPAGTGPAGGLRSYGSMTYAGLKSMVFGGVKQDDPRVKAALKWLSQHYTLDENPGLGQAGLYYYYHLMAKSLAAMDQPTFEDAAKKKHDWRKEMIAALLERQRADGAWVNPDNKWMEGDANLVTAFALLTLDYCDPADKADAKTPAAKAR